MSNSSEVLEENSQFFSVEQLIAACAENGTRVGAFGTPVKPNHDDLDVSSTPNQTPEMEQKWTSVLSCAPKLLHAKGPYKNSAYVGQTPRRTKRGTAKKLEFHCHDVKPEKFVLETQDLEPEPNFQSQDTFGEFSVEVPKPKGRETWVRTINYKKRMRGEGYIGFSTKRSNNQRRRTPQDQNRKPREMGPTCSSRLCLIRASRKCNRFSFEDRLELFTHFWKNMTWDEKRTYILSLVDQRTPLKRTVTDQPKFRKKETYIFYLKLCGVKQQVCRNMFLSTLGIGRAQLHGWLRRPISKQRRIGLKRGGDSDFAVKYLLDLPKLPSHYCRKDTGKLYLEPVVHSKTHLYQIYKEHCRNSNVLAVSRWRFFKHLDEQRISIHQVKKDQCDTCCSHSAGLVSEEEYKTHLENKERAREEKQNDKANSFDNKCHVVTIDLQSVLLSPVLNASALYYKTKLVVHNFTVYNLKTKQVKCFLWDESHGELVASAFATCIVKFLDENFQNDSLPIVIFSDGCTNQNRNAILSNALSHYAVSKNKTVVQKYLEKGHTQMEVDSVHATIEKHLKNKSIYIPMDYINICKNARQDPFPYEVEYLDYSEFYDYTGLRTMGYASIRPGSKTGDPHVTDIRQIKYMSDGIIQYKLMRDGEWQNLPRSPKKVPANVTFPKLYHQRLEIPKRKYQDLLDLLRVTPEKYHQFYKDLPRKND